MWYWLGLGILTFASQTLSWLGSRSRLFWFLVGSLILVACGCLNDSRILTLKGFVILLSASLLVPAVLTLLAYILVHRES